MVLTRRASRCILRWLPNELLSDIISLALVADKVSLCRVSRLFNALAILSLYRVVTLNSYTQLCQFRAALSNDSTRASVVRTFSMSDTLGDPGSDDLPETSFYGALSTMDRVEILELEVSPFDERYMGILRHCTFPRLHDFKYISPISQQKLIQRFLCRHPDLSRLIIGGLDTPVDNTSNLPLPLPKLRYYVGPTSFMDFFPPGIKQILLLWTVENPDIDASFMKLGPLTSQGTQLVFSSLYIRDPHGAIFGSLARHLQHTECIQLRSVANQTGRLEDEYIDAVSRSLGSFTALRYLALEFLALLDPVRAPAEATEQDRGTVEKWGHICPSLRECCFRTSPPACLGRQLISPQMGMHGGF
ncbi:hypothetical protein B0H10DRAFT_2078223 [Mycena sp. CBHHK59/15]|nr:hypothetical protein B0H10DRAFT_2078223 [Mycena sp. CBHHK59/15]